MSLVLLSGLNITAEADSRLSFDRKWGEQQGWWTIFWNDAQQGCFAATEYTDGTTLWFGLNPNGEGGFVAFGNQGWSNIKDGVEYQVEYVFDNSRWNGPVVGASIGQLRILYSPFVRADFIEDIARSSNLFLMMNGSTITSFQLKGTRRAMEYSVDCTRSGSAPVVAAPSTDIFSQLVDLADRASTALDDGRFDEAIAIYLERYELSKQVGSSRYHGPALADLLAANISAGRTDSVRTITGDLRSLLEKEERNWNKEMGPYSQWPSAYLENYLSLLDTLEAAERYLGQGLEADAILRRHITILNDLEKVEGYASPVSAYNLALKHTAIGNHEVALELYVKAFKGYVADGWRPAWMLNDAQFNVVSSKEKIGKYKTDPAVLEMMLVELNGIVARNASDKDSSETQKFATLADVANLRFHTILSVGAASRLKPDDFALCKELIAAKMRGRAIECYYQGAVWSRQMGDYQQSNKFLFDALSVKGSDLDVGRKDIHSLILENHDRLGQLQEIVEHVERNGLKDEASVTTVLAAWWKERREDVNSTFLFAQRKDSSVTGKALSNFAARIAAGDNDVAEATRRLQDNKQAYSFMLERYYRLLAAEDASSEKLLGAQKAELERMRTQIEADESTIRSNFPKYAEYVNPSAMDLKSVQLLLQKDEALLFVDTDPDRDALIIWAINADEAGWVRLESSLAKSERLISEMIAGLNPNAGGRFEPSKAFELYSLTFGNLSQFFRDKKHLVFVLNGALTSIPPHVLAITDPKHKTSRDIDWLVKHHAVTVMPSVASLSLLRQTAAQSRAAKPIRAYADIQYSSTPVSTTVALSTRTVDDLFNGGLADVSKLKGSPILPATGPEARAVAAVLGGTETDIMTGRRATESDVKTHSLVDYRVLYFATHGLVAGDVAELAKVKAEPALLLAVPDRPSEQEDGLLTATEVSELKLNADWVVLSACNTAAGDRPGAEPLSGLARAFFYAGARSLLVSHWPVVDDSTEALMVNLFQNVQREKALRPAEALQKAILVVMADPAHPEWSEPTHWAPFILVGEPHTWE